MKMHIRHTLPGSNHSWDLETSDYEWAKTIVKNKGNCGNAFKELLHLSDHFTEAYLIGNCDGTGACPLRKRVRLGVCTYGNACEAAKDIMEEEAKLIIET